MQQRFTFLFLTLSLIVLGTQAQNTFPSSGAVGIGTTIPQQRLHMEGSANQAIFVNTTAPSNISGSGIIGYMKALPGASGHRLGYFLFGSRGGEQFNYNVAGMVGYAGGAWTSSSRPAYLAFETTALGSATRTEKVRIDPSGNVGVGTTTPTARLDVRRGDGQSLLTKFINSSSLGDRSAIVEMQNGDSVLWRYGVGGTGSAMGLTNGQFHIEKAGVGPLFTITQGGNVGIGTVNPTKKLHIEGKGLITEGLIVEGGIITVPESSPYKVGLHVGGEDRAISAFSWGVGVVSESPDGPGIWGMSNYGTGVLGTSSDGIAIQGENNSEGWGVLGRSAGGNGVTGYCTAYTPGFAATDGVGVYGSINQVDDPEEEPGWAGYFNGNVYGSALYQGSDLKLKQNIDNFSNSMNIINRLKPKSYEYRKDGDFKLMNLPNGKHFGLIAQDVEKVLPNLVKVSRFDIGKEKHYANFKLDSQKTRQAKPITEKMEFKAVNYTELIPIMVKALQEQDAENKQLREDLSDMKKRLSNLEALLTSNNSTSVNVSSAYLEQNSPNPSRGATIIRYGIPEGAASAMLTLSNAKGQLLKTININGRGAGQVNLNTSSLSAGVYNYSLWIAGREVDTKQLVITR